MKLKKIIAGLSLLGAIFTIASCKGNSPTTNSTTTSNTSESPVVSTTPIVSTPVVPTTPNVTTTPVVPTTPNVTTTPVVPTTPIVTTTPVVPTTPVVTTTPVVPTTPNVTTTPVVPTTPNVTTTPVVPTTPVVTTTPTTSTTTPDPVASYTVSFVVYGGTEVESITIYEGQVATKPANPTRDGFVFLGWYIDDTFTNEFNFVTPITSDLVLHAKWEEIRERTKYDELIEKAGLLYNNDFNNYLSTDTLASFTDWGTLGQYFNDTEKNSAADSSLNNAQLGNGNVYLYDNSTNGSQYILDFGNNYTEGKIEGYVEVTTSNIGDSWTFLQFFGLRSTETVVNEIFGIRVDKGILKYRLNGGSVASAETSISSANTLYAIYYVFDMDSKKITVTVNNQPFVTNLSISADAVSGYKLTSSDNGYKTLYLDNVAVVAQNYTVEEYKEIVLNQLQSKYDSYDVENNYPTIKNEMDSLLATAKQNILNATTKVEIEEIYNNAVSSFENQVLALAKANYKTQLDSYVNPSDYTINASLLNTAINNGYALIDAATNQNELVIAFANAKLLIDAVENDTVALQSAKNNALAELESYKSASNYTINLEAFESALSSGKELINNETTISGVNSALISAKSLIDNVKDDAQVLSETKVELVSKVNDEASRLIALLDATTNADTITQINSIKNEAITNINASTSIENAKSIADKSMLSMEAQYEASLLSLSEVISSAKSDLTEYANAKISQNNELTNEITTTLNQGLTNIGNQETKEAVLAELENAMNAIDLVIAENTSGVKGDVSITAAEGEFEQAYLEWDKVSGATNYKVYYKSKTKQDASYKEIDDMLIREYPNNIRADIVGIAADEYEIKVVPVFNNNEGNYSSVNVTVSKHDRTGYAFVNGSSSGAYNENGTLKENAVVLYVTKDNMNTISYVVNGTETTGIQNIITAWKKDTRPLSIRLIGNITDPATLLDGDIVIDGTTCGITFEGIGNDATANGWGLRIKNSSNVEVRNIGFMNCNSGEGDNLGLQQSNDHCWVHHCDFFYGDAGSDADQAKGDGALDTKKSTYVTHSYNHFWDTGKSNLQGMKSETTENYITYHHNWYDHSDSRHPRIRTCTVHIYNNFFDGNAKYGVGVTMGASAFVENNYFRNCKNPMLASEQGTDALGEGTFSGEAGGIIKSYNNYITGDLTQDTITYQENSTSFDVYEASSRNETVPSSVKTLSGGTTYNNFDTSSSFYTYNVETPEQAMNTTTKYAGRLQGGDFQYEFNDAVDDPLYSVDTTLKGLLTNYSTTLVKVLGSHWTNEGGEEGPSAEELLQDEITSAINNVTTKANSLISELDATEHASTIESINNIKNNAITSLNAATSSSEITTISNTAISSMQTLYDDSLVSIDDLRQSSISEITQYANTNIAKYGDISTEINAVVTNYTSTINQETDKSKFSSYVSSAKSEIDQLVKNFAGTLPVDDIVCTFDGKTPSNSMFTVNGNYKTGVSVTYEGTTYTTALKIESSTSITFTTDTDMTLIIVSNCTSAKGIKVDGTSYDCETNGVFTISLSAGSHTISKGDSMQIVLIKLTA